MTNITCPRSANYGILQAAILLSTVPSIGTSMVSLQREQAYKKKEAIVIAIAVIIVFASAEVGL
ncbi:MAG: hypothetical protein WBL44_06245 [Nitrososphaeraceae archaeon]|jgi:hypothetical protein